MQTCICIGGLVLAADAAAWVLTAETGDSRWVVLITSGTGIVVAFCTAVVMAAPHLAKAITSLAATILPALAVIRKQNEELNKGTLSERIETLLAQNQTLLEQNQKLQKTVEEDRARTEDANKKLHDIRDEFQTATLQHREQREALIAQLGAMTNELAKASQEIADLKEYDSRRLKGVEVKQELQAVKQEHQAAALTETQAAVVSTQAAVVENRAAIEQIVTERAVEKSGSMPVVELPKNEEPS